MRPKLRAATWIALLALAVTTGRALPAEAPPKPAALPMLFDNGHAFLTPSQRLAIRCLDQPGLLSLPRDEQAQVLDRAAAAGFNAVSFEAPLFGPQGLCRKLGQVDEGFRAGLSRVLEACSLRQLYAFPVLYPTSAVRALAPSTVTASTAAFFAGRNALGWQAWALGQAAKTRVLGIPIGRSPVIGGWILYRGPWPGLPPLPGRGATPTAQVQLRAWAAWHVKLARHDGLRQELGLGLWAKRDLGQGTEADSSRVRDGDAAPVAPPSTVSFDPAALATQGQDLDNLPPVPGADAERVDDQATIPITPSNPWDLEGLDWAAVDAYFADLPLASQVGFLELTLDTEDWYRVGDRLAESAERAEVPLLWRQDWRTASRYERGKRLAPPAPLAGLVGPWPDDDWPPIGEALWPSHDTELAASAPFYIRSTTWEKDGAVPVLRVQLSRPADLELAWGLRAPLEHHREGSKGRDSRHPKADHIFRLPDLKPGSWVLIQLRAGSPRFGSCVLRTHWMQVPR